MVIRWATIKAFVLLLVIAAGANGAALRPSDRSSQPAAPRLNFGQTIAFSDFDADGLIDQAHVVDLGAHRSVRVLLSRSRKPLTLHLDNRSANGGSLFAQDIDNDGAADLIWTDLLHRDCVVVWLGNGDGEFVRVPASLYAGGYTLPDRSVNNPDETIRETCIASESNRRSEAARQPILHSFLANCLPQQGLVLLTASSTAFGEPTDRGPPPPRS